MKKFSLLVLAMLGAFVLSACSNTSAANEDIVAESKNGNITKDQFYNELVNRFGDKVLKEMLYNKVLSEKVSVKEKEIKAEIDKLKESYGDKFQSVLQQNGFSSVKQLEDSIRSKMMKEKAISNGVEVTEKEIKSYYENKKHEVKASHILVDSKSKAQEVKDKLAQGKDFATLAKEYSKDKKSAKNGGDLGYFSTGGMVLPFEKAAFNLEVGKVSEPVKSQYGYHIIKVADKREKEDAKSMGSFEEMKNQLKQELQTRKADPNKLSEVMKNAEINIKVDSLKDKISF